MIIRIAFKNIFRHKKRSILTFIAILFGIMFSIFGKSFNKGLEQQWLNTYFNTQISNYQIFDKGFYKDRYTDNPINYTISNEKEIIKLLKSKNKIFTSRITFNGNVINSDGTNKLRLEVLGVNPDHSNAVFNRSKYILSGYFLKNKNEIVVSSYIAHILGTKLNQTVTLEAQRPDNSINAIDLKVAGIIDTQNSYLDSRSVFIRKKDAFKFLGINKTNNIIIKSNLSKNTLNILKSQNIDIIPFRIGAKDVIEITNIRQKFFSIIGYLMILMAGFGIANVMMMAMMERRKEIGIMMANGMQQSEILSMFLIEGLILGIIGSGLGFLAGFGLSQFFHVYGIPLPYDANIASSFGVPCPLKLYPYFDLKSSLHYLIIGILMAVVASLYSAFKASNLNPVDVIRD